jgi:hypothetical protein
MSRRCGPLQWSRLSEPIRKHAGWPASQDCWSDRQGAITSSCDYFPPGDRERGARHWEGTWGIIVTNRVDRWVRQPSSLLSHNYSWTAFFGEQRKRNYVSMSWLIGVSSLGLDETNEQNFPWPTVLAAVLYRPKCGVYLLLLVLFLFQFSCSWVRKAWGRCI